MILYPAIDIRGGRAVRLVQGDYGRETAFDSDPLDAARRWADQGARALHVVDLDGAREGAPVSIKYVRRICAATRIPVQLGGGLRTAEDVVTAFEAGVERVVLGTAALADPALIEALTAEHGDRIVVSADAGEEGLAVEGWERASAISAEDLIRDLAGRGVRRFVFTLIEVDGTLGGPGIERLRAVARSADESGAELIYSGGIGSLDDLRALAEPELPALAGVIVGRALYDGRFTVREAQAAVSGR